MSAFTFTAPPPKPENEEKVRKLHFTLKSAKINENQREKLRRNIQNSIQDC
jgi:hypothetical protein